jgi:hypothetical protein
MSLLFYLKYLYMFRAFVAYLQEILYCLVSRYGKRKCGRELWCPVVSLVWSVFPWHYLSVSSDSECNLNLVDCTIFILVPNFIQQSTCSTLVQQTSMFCNVFRTWATAHIYTDSRLHKIFNYKFPILSNSTLDI